MTRNSRQQIFYVAADWATTTLAFIIFNVARYFFTTYYVGASFGSLARYMLSSVILLETVLYPVIMLGIYWLSGFYFQPFFKSRLQVAGNTLVTVAIGMLLFFLSAMMNDIPARRLTYWLILIFYGVNVVCVGGARMIIATHTSRMIHGRRWSKPTLIVGTGREAGDFVRRLNSLRKSMGFKIVGLIETDDGGNNTGLDLPVLKIDRAAEFCRQRGVEAVIVIPTRGSVDSLLETVGKLMPLDVSIYVKPDMSNPASRAMARFNNVAGEPLVDISRPRISGFTINLKRTADVVFSALALAVTSPLMIAISIAIALDSRGPVIYRQTRVGYHRRKFRICKFRSMKVDAEAAGPALSSTDDDRVTRVGRVLRKYRLDELPNFWNVLKGDMSIVGPRPEREYFVNQLLERAPFYSLVHSVRPGITSWGMVKFGYASSVDEMLERLDYDILYVENMSISVDMKILFYTVHTVVTGKGI